MSIPISQFIITDVENKRMDTKGGKWQGEWGDGGVMNWEQ